MSELAGSGIELASVPRFRSLAERYGERLLHRLFTAPELESVKARPDATESLAVRFCAKAAARRALRPLASGPLRLRELRVDRSERGEPRLELLGETARRLPSGLRLSVSLTHDRALCLASVWVERQGRTGESRPVHPER